MFPEPVRNFGYNVGTCLYTCIKGNITLLNLKTLRTLFKICKIYNLKDKDELHVYINVSLQVYMRIPVRPHGWSSVRLPFSSRQLSLRWSAHKWKICSVRSRSKSS